MGKRKRGDCFEVNGAYFLDHYLPGMKLVHGVVINQNDHLPMRHCWIEVTEEFTIPSTKQKFTIDYVIDKSNGNDVYIPKNYYYNLGKIGQTVKYSLEEYRKNLLKHNHWGDWGTLEVDR